MLSWLASDTVLRFPMNCSSLRCFAFCLSTNAYLEAALSSCARLSFCSCRLRSLRCLGVRPAYLSSSFCFYLCTATVALRGRPSSMPTGMARLSVSVLSMVCKPLHSTNCCM